MKGRIKVLQLTVGLGWGGAEKLMADIAMRLPSERYDCHVVSLKGDGPVGDVLRHAGIRVVPLGGGPPWKIFQRLWTHVSREVPDIIHSHLLKANLFGALLPGPHKLLWHIHNTSEQTGFSWRFVESRLIRRCSVMIAVSEAVGRDVSRRIPSIIERLRVIPNGIDSSRFSALLSTERGEERKRWGLAPDVPVIGYVGRLEEKTKKLTHLIEAFAHLRRSKPEAVLLIVGEGPDRKMLDTLFLRRGLSDAVLFVGAQKDVEKVYPLMDVYVQPSVSEGFGLSLLEAMASGVPIVATLTGGIPEVVADRETGILVPPGNPLAMAKAMDDLISDANLARTMGNSGRQRVKNRFDIDPVLGKIEGLYAAGLSKK
jgi:glycosyltransferase involved in cell wall biosynthesis